MKKRIKTNGILAGLGIVTYIALLILAPSHYSPVLNKALVSLAFSFFLIGMFLRIVGRAYKLEHSKEGNALVRDGLYAAVRNPMYLGSFLTGVAFTFLLGNPWIIIIFIIVFFLRFQPQVRTEEKILLERFGEVYQEYLSSVPRFIPKINKIFKKEFKKYFNIKNFPWIKKELWTAFGWLVLFLLIAFLKDLRHYDLTEYLWELIIFAVIVVIFLFFISYAKD
ncbi:MAG: isoprenylcysteine carboxylmethyltransferase family protein [Candidatus Omnitrophota bacterium]|nr:isoprenylcysteine carboxylmethyltransferase family protein [Candidatus Omnitrophota bacterium]